MGKRSPRPGFLRLAAFGALCGFLTLSFGTAHADITIEHSVVFEGVGAMALGNMSGTNKTTIAGNNSRTDSDMQMKSKVIGFLARGAVGPSADIVRLDDDKLYHLNVRKKEYTETTFEQMREQLKKATDKMNESGGDDKRKQPSAIDESKCEWLPAKVDVKKTGEKAQFAGYDAERTTITAIQPCKDKDTGSICEVALSLDEWLSTGFTESAEVQRFYKAYAAKMGLDLSNAQDISQRAQAMFSQYKSIWQEVAAKMQGVKGYPVRTSFTLALGGEQCQNSNAKQAQAQSNDSSNSDSSSNNSPSSLAGQMAGKLGGLFHKKKDDADTPPPAAATPTTTPPPLPPGEVPVMTVTSTLVSVSTSSASSDAFTVPADYKKQELKTQ